MRGGSRYGAGRPGWRRKCEQSQALDIRQLHRRKLLYPGAWFSWKWTNNYGEVRAWFRCPQCWRRCAVVYFGAPGGRYACRKCLRLAYMSEAEGAMDRLWRKQRKLERPLGDEYEKPKGMHWRTYERLTERINDIEQEKDSLFVVYAGRLLGVAC